MARIDARGRVVLPLEVRRRAHIEVGDEVDVSADLHGCIYVIATAKMCGLCGSRKRLVTFGDDPPRTICAECAEQVPRTS